MNENQVPMQNLFSRLRKTTNVKNITVPESETFLALGAIFTR